jgi:deoxyribodipyrimidine photo-lyase
MTTTASASVVSQEIQLLSNRAERNAQLREMFPQAAGADCIEQGGRAAALARLASIDPLQYSRTRNHIAGSASRLSPYLRHGMVTLKEAAEVALKKANDGAQRFVFELAWRDYWRRVWWQKGTAIRSDLEPAKVILGDSALPSDIVAGDTGLPCMDSFIDELKTTGYVHNHARMWFASYVIHHRKIDWRAGADWYYGELLDGDWASNHLSWQWVASSFANKPYIFNKENLAKFTDGKYCDGCKVQCPFDASYQQLETTILKFVAESSR